MKRSSFILIGSILVIVALVGTYTMSVNLYMFHELPLSLPTWTIAVYAACLLALIAGSSLVVHAFLMRNVRD